MFLQNNFILGQNMCEWLASKSQYSLQHGSNSLENLVLICGIVKKKKKKSDISCQKLTTSFEPVD